MLPHLTAIIIFLIISAIYFSPQLKGDKLHQNDKLQSEGMSKEIADFRKETGEETLWTNSTFGGMPAYQIFVKNNNVIKDLKSVVLRIIPRPIGYMFFLMIGFYILLLCFSVNPWLAIIGGIAFGLSSINVLYLGGGHNAKVHAISFIPPIIGGIFYAYRKNAIKGAAILSLFTCLHLSANHFQMTYYLLYLILAIVIVELYIHLKQKLLPKFIKTSSVLLIAGILGALPIFSNLFLTYEYSKYTIRGESELTISANEATKKVEKEALSSDYIKQYSLGFGEVWSLVIPDVKGGKMGYLGNEKEIMSSVSPNLKEQVAQHPSYWGEQASTGGAFYFGASIFLLFVLGMFFIKDKLKWALLTVSLLAIILSWKYGSLVDWFINNAPLFDKFRDTKMMLIIAQLSFPLLGLLFINKLFKDEIDKKKFIYVSLGVIGLLTVFYIMPTVWFGFLNNSEISFFDKMLVDYKGNSNAISQIRDWQNELINARVGIFKKDTFRSLFFVSSTALIIYLFSIKKLKKNLFILILGVLVLIDLWGVDKRYLNEDNFVSKRQERQFFQKTEADKYILQDKDPNYRVINYTVPLTFSDASTSYYHKSLGGYHGAKLKRYNELIEFHISKNNIQVLNMLNTKYLIVPDKNRQPLAQINPDALGNAWFVEDFRIVPDANTEIQALSDFDPSREAIIDVRYEDFVAGKSFTKDTLSSIKLDIYKPNHLTYSANCSEEKLAVFSEIHYPKGWNVSIDGKSVEHFRANYVLRALVIPEGEHIVEFKFEPKTYFIGQKISFASSIILLLSLFFVFGKELYIRYSRKDE